MHEADESDTVLEYNLRASLQPRTANFRISSITAYSRQTMPVISREEPLTHRAVEKRYRDNIRIHLDRLARVMDQLGDGDLPSGSNRNRRSKATVLCIATQMLVALHNAIEVEATHRDGLCQRLEMVGRQVQCDSCPFVSHSGWDDPTTVSSGLLMVDGSQNDTVESKSSLERKHNHPTCQR
jgi:hypothetical protein